MTSNNKGSQKGNTGGTKSDEADQTQTGRNSDMGNEGGYREANRGWEADQ